MAYEPLAAKDRHYMSVALRLAQRGRGYVEPNPMVGAVLVRNGKVVGRGWHHKFGLPHAEIEALNNARSAARGATLYVNLEPCCHTGKTGPCTTAIIAAGIRRVVVAMTDPNPLVKGKGIRRLRQAGIHVTTGVLEAAALELNRPFTKWITHRQPYVLAKWAQSIDGCIADSRGQSQWISSAPSRALVHQWRARMDGIMVGIGTALADDPLLTARPQKSSWRRRPAVRIIIDSQCRLPLPSQLVQTAAAIPTMVLHRRELAAAALRRRAKLLQHGVQCIGVENHKNGRIILASALSELGKYSFTNILVEGGAKLLGALLAENLIDEGLVFIAPKIVGDQHARHAVEGIALPSIQNAIPVVFRQVTTCGDDILLHWYRHDTPRAD
ncbi:MAG: bifunctional diaminohydroxyphosphoribosylaminopyrimidine deaminase/5-amino-6-(5-phosphoribosylamino)uracil reductase RibD [Phycisphaerae bacterium]